MTHASYLEVIRLIADRLKDQSLVWVITGSFGMALQGMDVEIHDIDLQTDKNGAYIVEECLREFSAQKVALWSNERLRSYFGNFIIDGIKVEVIGDFQKCVDTIWGAPPDLIRLRKWVEIDGLTLPVLDLEYECQAYIQMGRIEKAKKIRRFLDGRAATPGSYDK